MTIPKIYYDKQVLYASDMNNVIEEINILDGKIIDKPTYEIPTYNTNLSSGEPITTAFGKIAKAISSLINHLADSISHITSTERTNWNNASTRSHTHNNKTVLDNIKDTDIVNWNNASENVNSLIDMLAIKDENGNIITDENNQMIIK